MNKAKLSECRNGIYVVIAVISGIYFLEMIKMKFDFEFLMTSIAYFAVTVSLNVSLEALKRLEIDSIYTVER